MIINSAGLVVRLVLHPIFFVYRKEKERENYHFIDNSLFIKP